MPDNQFVRSATEKFNLVRKLNIMPCLLPRVDGTTHCNDFLGVCASAAFGYDKLLGLSANEQIRFMESSKEDFLELKSGLEAEAEATAGAFVVAGESGPIHGHVCVVLPGKGQDSGNLGGYAPVVANVGKNNFNGKHAGFAFPKGAKVRYFKLLR